MKKPILALLLCALCAGCSGCYSTAVQDMIERADAAIADNAPAQEVEP